MFIRKMGKIKEMEMRRQFLMQSFFELSFQARVAISSLECNLTIGNQKSDRMSNITTSEY